LRSAGRAFEVVSALCRINPPYKTMVKLGNYSKPCPVWQNYFVFSTTCGFHLAKEIRWPILYSQTGRGIFLMLDWSVQFDVAG
jgi:hypothetical protein